MAPPAVPDAGPSASRTAEPAELGSEVRTSAAPRDSEETAGAAPRVSDPSAPIAVVFLVREADGASVQASFGFECRDALGRVLPFVAESAARRRVAAVPPGSCRVSVLVPGRVHLVRDVAVQPSPAEQFVEVRVESAPFVRIRWQTESGEPFLTEVERSGLLRGRALARVALDDAARAGEGEAARALHAWTFPIGGEANAAGAPRPEAWPGALPDAVCEVARHLGLPAHVVGSIDGVVLAAATLVDPAPEVVLRTPLARVAALRSGERVCLVDESGVPLADVQVGGMTRAGVGRFPANTGPDGCLLDERYTAGLWFLAFRDGGGEVRLRRRVELPPGSVLDLGTIALERGTDLLARVRLADGQPVAGVALLLESEDAAVEAPLRLLTDPSGFARFPGVPSGRHAIRTVDPRFARAGTTLDAWSPGRPPVELVVEPGVELALDVGPSLAVARRLLVYDARGGLVAAEPVGWSGLVALRLVPGTYEVELEGAPDARRITVDGTSAIYDLR